MSGFEGWVISILIRYATGANKGFPWPIWVCHDSSQYVIGISINYLSKFQAEVFSGRS